MGNIWIRERLKKLGKTQMGLAKELGLARSAINKMIDGDRQIAATELPTMARYLEWPESTVLRHIESATGGPIDLNVDIADARPTIGVPVIGEVEAGIFKDAVEYAPEDQIEIDVPTTKRFPGVMRKALKVRGPSMNVIYPPGSYVIVVSVIDLGDEWEPKTGQKVVVQRRNREGQFEATVKELMFDTDGQAWLWPKSTHPEFQQPWRVPESWDGNGDFEEHNDELRITGLVVGAWTEE